MNAAGILPYEFVHVNNVRNGVHWETYVIPGKPGEITLNGPPAHHFQRGDKVVIFTLANLTPAEISEHVHTVVFPTPHNSVKSVTATTIKKAMDDALDFDTHIEDNPV